MRLFVLPFLFIAMAARAQVFPQGPQTSYEGENVSVVALISNPHRDLQPLYAKILQKAGEPYSPAKVQASVEELQRAGNFSRVEVNVIPEIEGLRLNFLLEPAYYIGVVAFPGAQEFSYTRLLQLVNLQDEDPYDPRRIPVAEKALRDFLHREGYFQAEVHAETSIDDAHKLVSVKFAVRMGKQARIGSIKIEGVDSAESARLEKAARSLRARLAGGVLKPGKPYVSERITSATSLMKRVLLKQHRLASTIHEAPPQYHAENNRVDVSFAVTVGPVVDVRVTGARLSAIPFLAGRALKKLVPVYSEGAVDQDLVDEGQQNLIDYFQKKGFADVKVTTTFQKNPDQILVVYQVDRGQKHKVSQIRFQGNHALTEKKLLPVVTVRKAHIWTHGSVNQVLLKQSASNLEGLYRDHGFEEVKVTARTVDHESSTEIEFDIHEGRQTIVEEVKITGNDHIAHDQLTAPVGFQLRAGSPFSPRKLADDRNRISANYLNGGYLNAEVKAKVDKGSDPYHAVVSYLINEHQLVRIGEVVYLGQERTKLSLIKRAAQTEPETPMRRGGLLESESRLYDLNIFDWSSVGPGRPITDQSEEETLVKVHEAKRNELTYGFGFEISHRGGNVPGGTVALPGGGGTIGLGNNQIAPSQSTFASPRGLIEYSRRNMRGLGETASASILLSRLDQKAITTYLQPHFIGSDWKSLTSFSVERTTENPLFAATLGDLSFQVERLLNPKTNTRLQLRYDLNKTSLSQVLVPELVLSQDRNIILSTVSGTLIRDTRDKPLDAHRGSYSTVDLAITPSAFGSSANFARLFGQYAYYQPIHSIVFANSVRLGFAKAFAGSFVPTSQLYFSGGGNSLRSFPIDEAGPQRIVPFCNVLKNQTGCVNITVPVGGRELFIANSEVRFPLGLTKALGGVVFYDGGNVYSAINLPNFLNNYTNTVGFGLRYSTPIGPVRIDIGHNLNPVPGINPTQYYITIGQAF